MVSILDQPWWADIAVISVFVIAIPVLIALIRGRNCIECKHKATVRQLGRNYCERCYRQKFGVPIVRAEPQRATAAALAILAMPATTKSPSRTDRRKRKPVRKPVRAQK